MAIRRQYAGTISDLLNVTARPDVFMSYYHDADQWYCDELSRVLHDTYRTVTDRSLDDEIDSYDSEYVMRRIREEFITGTSCTFVLYGPDTYRRKFIDWETKATLDKSHGLIGIALPTVMGVRHYVPWRLWDNQQSGYAVMTDWWTVINNPQSVPLLVADAKLRSPFLINNSREMMTYNT